NSKNKTITISADTIVDKIRGGMLGQIIGNVNGFAYEFKFFDKPGEIKEYTPALPEGGVTDDDTDFEWVYISKMQQSGVVMLPYQDINNLWIKSINKNIWCANRYARYLMDLGISAPLTGNTVINPWSSFNLSGQFLCETYGLVAPAMPQTAAKIGLHYTRVAIDDEPAQTTQLFTTMVSTAFVEKDMNKILDAGIASLDAKSKFQKIIADVKKWHQENPDDWQACRKLIHENFQIKDNLTRNRNGTEMNTAAIIGAFLYGKGDFKESIRLAFNFGYDADCNAATIGTILGAKYGYKKMMSEGWQITDRYKNTNRDGMPMDETITSYADRVIAVFEMVNKQNGGSKELINHQWVYKIASESPKNVYALKPETLKKVELIAQYQKQITLWLLNSDKKENAKAVYMAVCLDRAEAMKKAYPKQWENACYNLSGYWKVMNNIFYGDKFNDLVQLKEKFIVQGFKKPAEIAKSDELFNDKVFWKKPEGLY
ncbi:MAG: ADP-ribosylglycohydrolase family protein, partial [Pedobacter sp.]|nr:ADP-ribosylglycohydrolase family protein [Pedobacter sp.]